MAVDAGEAESSQDARMVRPPPAEIPKHIAALDGVRGIAIVAVLLFHANGGAHSFNPIVRGINEVLQLGWGGVTLFFVLSGFLITNLLWSSRGQPHWWRRFYIRRALRIFPLYYLALGIVLVYAIATGTLHWAAPALTVYALYLQNLPLPTIAHEPFALKQFWSLAVEEQFYLVWPWLLLAMPSLRSARRMCVGIVVASTLLRAWFFLHMPQLLPTTLSHAGELAIGAWLALSLRDSPGALSSLRRYAPAVLVVGVAIAVACGLPWGTLQDTHFAMVVFGTLSLAIGSAALVVVALGGGQVAMLLSRQPLQHLGVISYGLYVYHMLFWHEYGLLAAWLLPHGSIEKQLMLKSALMLVLTVMIAELSYRCFEKPILRWKDKLAPARAIVLRENG